MAAALTSLALGSSVKKREVKPPLVRVRTIFQRGEAPEILDVEANLDPLEILKAAGVGIVVGGVALVAGWLLWDGLAAPTPFGPIQVFNGMKDSPFWKTEASRARTLLTIRRLRKGALSGEGTIPDPGLYDDDPCVVSEALFNAETNAAFRAAFKADAKTQGCAWAQ